MDSKTVIVHNYRPTHNWDPPPQIKQRIERERRESERKTPAISPNKPVSHPSPTYPRSPKQRNHVEYIRPTYFINSNFPVNKKVGPLCREPTFRCFIFMEVRRVELLSKVTFPFAPTCFPFGFISRSGPAREGRLNSNPAQNI